MISPLSDLQLTRIHELLAGKNSNHGLLLVMQSFPGTPPQQIISTLITLAEQKAHCADHALKYYRLAVEIFATCRPDDLQDGLHATRCLVEYLQREGRQTELTATLSKTLPLVKAAAKAILRKDSEQRLLRKPKLSV